MPKLGMEPIRKAALIEATIHEIGLKGSLDVTVSQIAKRAGMSSALAHHYFGSKEEMLLAAMRHIMTHYAIAVREALREADSPQARLSAIFRASFGEANFQPEAVASWLNFWVLAQISPQARRLLSIYERRLQANLVFALRPLIGRGAPAFAATLGALIDGIYLRQALTAAAPDAALAVAQLEAVLHAELATAAPDKAV